MVPSKRMSLITTSTLAAGFSLVTILAATPAAAADDQPANTSVAKTPAAQQADASAGGTQQGDTSSGDIVVTARKRNEDILKTPISVSALTSNDIAKRGIVSLNDLANSTPSINISNISSGRNDRSFQQFSLRGFTPSISTSTLTAMFIDGVPVASTSALNSITDPERIEILKGPQSAYFGRNTFAGAINVVNKLPGDQLAGSVNASVGTRNNFDVGGAIEAPIIPDVLSFRLTGRSFSKDGSYVNNADRGQTLGDQKTSTGTLLVVLKPSSNFTVKAFGLYSEDHDGPSAQGILSAYEVRSNNGAVNVPFITGNTNGTVILPSVSNCTLSGFTTGLVATEARVSRPFVCGALPSLPAGFSPAQNTLQNGLVNKFLADGSYRNVSPSDGVQGYGLKRRYYHLHLNLDWEIPDTGITLSSLTGYNNEYYSELADLDNYDTTSLRNSAYATKPTSVLPYWDFPFLVERSTRDFSQEGRASFEHGPFRGVIGASYLLTKSDSDLVSGNTEFVSGVARPSSSRSAPQKSKTIGGFFGLTYTLGKFMLSAEGRYQSDKIYAYTGGNTAGLTIRDGNSYGLPPGTFGPLSEFYSKTYNNFLPRVIGQFQFNDDLMAYASYSKGVNVSLASFNTNFLNGSPTIVAGATALGLGVVVQPEKLTNYEVGLKGKLFDGMLRFALDAYAAEWTNQQNNRTGLVLDEPPPGGTGVIQQILGVANAGRVLLKGVELDVTATPTRNLIVNLGAALNDSNVRAFSDPATSKYSGVIGAGFIGNQLPSSSKYSGNLGIQYGTDIRGWDEGNWFARTDISYKSKQYGDYSNLTWIKARTLVNMRVGIAKGPVSLEAFVNNVFNNRNYISIQDNSVLTPDFSIAGTFGYLTVGLPELRTFGLKGTFKF